MVLEHAKRLHVEKSFDSCQSVLTVCCYLGKRPVAWKEYCGEYWKRKSRKAWVYALAAVFQPFPNKPWFLLACRTSPLKTVRKGKTVSNKQFLLFPQVFLTNLENSLSFSSNLKLWSATSFSLVESEICCLGKG